MTMPITKILVFTVLKAVIVYIIALDEWLDRMNANMRGFSAVVKGSLGKRKARKRKLHLRGNLKALSEPRAIQQLFARVPLHWKALSESAAVRGLFARLS